MCGLTVSGPFSDDLKIAFLSDSDDSPLELVSYFESPLHWEGEARPRAFLEGAELNPHVPEHGGECLGPVAKQGHEAAHVVNVVYFVFRDKIFFISLFIFFFVFY